jgi:NAD-dependent deacetylase
MEELIAKAAKDLVNSSYAIALTGAGMSTESGIPDFRGPNGIWTKNPDAERMAYEIYHEFLNDPKQYWAMRFNQKSLLGDLENAIPNPGHLALAELEKMKVLKSIITQNIDGLHIKAGNGKIIEYHGSVLKLRCPRCGVRFDVGDYDLEMLRERNKLPPLCNKCEAPIKGDVVHFNEPIPSDVARQGLEEANKCDLMLLCGTSAVIYPFAGLPRIVRQRELEMRHTNYSGVSSKGKIPAFTIIEVNEEPTPLTTEKISDYLIKGKTADILPRLVEHVREILE